MAERYRAADPPEFRRQIMELHRAGRSFRDLARESEPSFDTIADRVRQAAADAGQRPDLPSIADRAELACLRRDNHRLRQERDILAKAANVRRIRPTAKDKTPSGSANS